MEHRDYSGYMLFNLYNMSKAGLVDEQDKCGLQPQLPCSLTEQEENM